MADSLKPPQTEACWAPLSSTSSWSFLKLMSIESVMVYNHLILCQPHPLLRSIFPSIRVFSNQFALCIRWSKHWSFSHSPSNEWLISFKLAGLISLWFKIIGINFMAAVTVHSDLEPTKKKKKSVTASSFSPSICHGVTGPDARILGKKLETIYLFYVISVCQMVAHVT